jgi:hypothetical protein
MSGSAHISVPSRQIVVAPHVLPNSRDKRSPGHWSPQLVGFALGSSPRRYSVLCVGQQRLTTTFLPLLPKIIGDPLAISQVMPTTLVDSPQSLNPSISISTYVPRTPGVPLSLQDVAQRLSWTSLDWKVLPKLEVLRTDVCIPRKTRTDLNATGPTGRRGSDYASRRFHPTRNRVLDDRIAIHFDSVHGSCASATSRFLFYSLESSARGWFPRYLPPSH